MSSKPTPKSRSVSRRQFMADSARAACGVSLAGLGLSLYGESSMVHAAQALRPPGALPEREFLSACVRCGLCVQDCPWDTLVLGRLFDPVATGTPYFDARKVPCEMCDDIPCVKACPSGALDPMVTDIDDSRMGLAVLMDHETCLNMQGLRCDVCYRVCPLINEAITLEMQRNTRTGVHASFVPTVHSDHCTGCGKCEHACVLEEAAIRVIPRSLAKGELGGHYRWGWEEKQKAGGSLIPEALDLPDRTPTNSGGTL